MVPIAPGTFQMGSVAVGGAAVPVHAVTISQPFWMGKYEVTQAEYQALMGSNPSFHQGASYPNSSNRPVEQVSWFDAVNYCDALTAQESAAGRLPSGYEYRLPTEAEWEYCCRAGTTTEWSFSVYPGCSQVNFGDWGGWCIGQTTGVGAYTPNAWGIYDMHGNVYEHCLDGFSPYIGGAVTDPLSSGLNTTLRGGSWRASPHDCRSAARVALAPNSVYDDFGLRVVCAPVIP